MREYLENFFSEFRYPEDATAQLMADYDKILANEKARALFDNVIRNYEKTDRFNNGETLNDSTLAAREAGIRDDAGTFLIFCCLSRHLWEMYEKKGISRNVWYDTVCDLRYKAVECKNVKGYWGSFVSGWFGGFFDMTRFALGRLQFEKIGYPADWRTYENHGIKLTVNTPVINVHIPSGARLPYEAVLDSYRQAYEWYSDAHIDGKLPMICGSWLMYDGIPAISGEGTNTYNFVMDYETVISYVTEDFPDCWRLFDVEYTGDPTVLPRNGGLRRRYAEWLEAGNKPGAGCAVAFFDGEKIITKKEVK